MTQNLVPSPVGERGGGISKRDIFEKGTSFFAVVLLGVSSTLPCQLVYAGFTFYTEKKDWEKGKEGALITRGRW
jgi:hypothetical protein